MQDEQKQIKEMVQAIFDYVDTKNMGSVYICGNKANEKAKPFLHNTGIAEFMYRRGYRKQSDTAREVIIKLLSIIQNEYEYYPDGITLGAYAQLRKEINELAAEYNVEV